jgi:hypothetical protein
MNDNDLKIIVSDTSNQAKKTNWLLLALGCSMISLSIFSTVSPAYAQANGNEDYIEELKTKSEGIDDVGNNVYLVAAGTLAFGAGAKILKRVIYA